MGRYADGEEVDVKVSVSIVTYNHEKFIAQAIESVLMQETNFDYELIIGEDDSTDRTREIVKAYHEKYPEKIRLFLNDRKNVIYIDGRPTGRWNFINNLNHAKGQYIAYSDGDDYWTDPYKLQKQVDYLDSHLDCALCFHRVKKLYQDGSRKPHIHPPGRQKKTYSLEELIVQDSIPSCSMMFRNGLVDQFPDWYYNEVQGDRLFHILIAQHGNIGFIDQVMGVYRIHSGGVWSLKGIAQKKQWNIESFQVINEHLDFQYDKLIKSEIYQRRSEMAMTNGNRREACKYLFKYIIALPFVDHLPSLRRLFFTVVKLPSPRLYRFLKTGKDKLNLWLWDKSSL